jgi:penicillin-binding protein 1A
MTKPRSYKTLILWLLLSGSSGAIVVLASFYLYLSPQLPPVDTLRQVQLQTPLRIYSSDQKLIGEFGEKRRSPIRFDQIPQQYIDAILSAEDDDFYDHHGVSIKGLLRAVSQLLQTGRKQGGGSTITMQVARNFFLSFKQTYARKFNEILLALQIERELSKQEILELYVNKIFLGNRAYGIQAAAQVYYGSNIDQLNVAQLAMIAGLPKAPSTFNPIVNPKRALIRRNWILGRMLSLGNLAQADYDKAIKEPITAQYHGLKLDLNAPYLAEMARKHAIDLFGNKAYTDGYTITTTIDSVLQRAAQESLRKGLITYDKRHGYRGPEQTLIQEGDHYLEEWQTQLKAMPSFGGLYAAVVTFVGETTIEAMLSSGERVLLEWDDGLSSARAYITENRRGPRPKSASELFGTGDVIRVADNEGSWSLQQVPAAQSALVALNPENGGIRSLVGGFDFNQSNFNRAIQAKRQPGSNFKPFVYTAALENGFTAASLVNDAPIVVDDASLEGTWRPENSSGKFLGPTRLRKALYQSRNLVSIRVLRAIGINNAIASMDRFGLGDEALPRDLSLALGSYALTPLQVATGYAIFANGGYRVEPYLIEKITTVDDQIAYEALPLTVCRWCEQEEQEALNAQENAPSTTGANNTQQNDGAYGSEDDQDFVESSNLEDLLGDSYAEERTSENPIDTPIYPRAPRVIDEKVAYIIDSMLKDVVRKGTGVKAKALGRNDLAGKTGTTNGPTDAWYSGYNRHLVATTWLGFDQNSNLGIREFGGSAALPIWIDYMRTALEGVPESVLEQPDGLVTVRIDPRTGNIAEPGNPNAVFEVFREENVSKIKVVDGRKEEANASAEDAPPEELF